MIVVTVNGQSPASFVNRQKRVMTEEEHQQRIVRSVQRWNASTIRNHSGSRSSRGRVVFHREVANA